MSDAANYRKFWYVYGVELSKGSPEMIGDCPFCGKEHHLFVNAKKGLWDCKSCGEKGNHTTFLTQLHDQSSSSPEDLRELADDRGLKVETLQFADVKKSFLTGTYLLPTKNVKGNIVNLFRSDPEQNGDGVLKWPVLSSPAPCKQQLYFSDRLRKNQVVCICEGHWDTLALLECLLHLQQRGDRVVKKGKPDKKNSLYASYDVAGAPGATTFMDEWLQKLRNRDIWILYDNDDPGKKGVKRLLKLLRETNVNFERVRVLQWKQSDPNDIRDVMLSEGYLGAWNFITDRLVDVDMDEAAEADVVYDPQQCDTFEELLTHYDTQLHMSDSIRDTLAAMCSLAISTAPDGSQLGLRVIGPPGSAKSTLAEAISACKALVFPTSKFTGMVSGFPNLKKAKQIAEQMNGKNVVVKDADVMMQLPNKKQVESEIRDALGDGVIRANFKTGISEELFTNFSMTQCGTFVLKQYDDSNLGSRFVDIIIVDKKSDKKKAVLAAIKSEISKSYRTVPGERGKSTNKVLAPPTIGFLLYKREWIEEGYDANIEVSDLRIEQIYAMGELICWARSKVSREGKDELKFRPESEWPTRVAQYLTKFAKVLAVILSDNPKDIRVNRKVIQILQRICRDTSWGFHFEVIEILYNMPEGMTADQLGWKLNLSKTQSHKHCTDMLELGIIHRKKVKHNYGAGRASHYFQLSDDVRESYKVAFSKR